MIRLSRMTGRAKRMLRLGTALALSVIPAVAHACPVCFSAQNEENRFAFVAMTIFLTLLPLGMLGLGMGWAWRRMRSLENVGPERPTHTDEPASDVSSTARV